MTTSEKIKSILILLFIVFSLFIIGCKSDSPTEPVKSNRELLIQTWDLKQAVDIGTNPSQPIDVTEEIKYAYIKFNSDGSYTSSVMSGKWEFDEVNNQIILDKKYGNTNNCRNYKVNIRYASHKNGNPICQPTFDISIYFCC